VLKKISSHFFFPKRAFCVKNVSHSFSFLPHRALLHIPSSSIIIIVIKPSNHARNIDDTIDDEERD